MQSWTGYSHNGYLVFDYVDSGNYKYAGMALGSKKWQIKEALNGTHYVRAEVPDATLTIGQAYNVLIEVSGNTATLKVGGVTKTSHTFASGIHGGQVGLHVNNAHTHFKDVAIKVPVNVTKYYTFGGQRVAMRKDNVVYFLLSDHLGTTSVVVDSSGIVVAESRHLPYGEVRWSNGTLPTDYRFTGQRFEDSLGIYSMGARFYDPSLGRWLSADTIILQPWNPQSFNRYSYVRNNALKYIDPTGHKEEGECGFWGEACQGGQESVPPPKPPVPPPLTPEEVEEQEIEQMLYEIGTTESGAEAVAYVGVQSWHIRYGEPFQAGGFTYPWKVITIRRYQYITSRSILVHELAHAWLYPRIRSASVEQELAAESFAMDVKHELGDITSDEYEAWKALPTPSHYARIHGYCMWHCLLPDQQLYGSADAEEALGQAIFSWTMNIDLRDGCPLPLQPFDPLSRGA